MALAIKRPQKENKIVKKNNMPFSDSLDHLSLIGSSLQICGGDVRHITVVTGKRDPTMRPTFLSSTTLAAGIILLSTSAHAQPTNRQGAYFSGNIGVLKPNETSVTYNGYSGNISYDPGLMLTGAIGAYLGSSLRMELEIGYANAKYNSVTLGSSSVYLGGNINMYSALAGVYIDLPETGSVTPYVGGGAGVVNSNAYGSSATDFAMFGEIGLAFRISQSMSFVPSVRYIHLSNSDEIKGNDTAWAGKLGLRVNF
jgi:opacity protein-like surface antigen